MLEVWRRLVGAARAECICATEGCGGDPVWELDAEGVGSIYCGPCHDAIMNQQIYENIDRKMSRISDA